MQEEVQRYRIKVQQPKLKPKVTTVGFGNPRYNSMVVYQQGVLICCGCHLRLVDLKHNKVIQDRQIGCCQIFQIMENSQHILVINYDGLISILLKETLEIVHQFYAPGKEIRHASFTDKYLAISCELLDETEEGLLATYELSDIKKGVYEPKNILKGRFYFPEYLEDELTVLEYHDPNPKGRKRKETVLNEKLPITNQIVKFDSNFKVVFRCPIKQEGEILCCCLVKGKVYYLHTSKRMTIVDIKQEKMQELELTSKSFPHLIEPYEDGVVYASEANKLEYVSYHFDSKTVEKKTIEIKSMAIGGNLSLKFSKEGVYSLNQSGFHFYSYDLKKTFSQSIFSITNCGVVFNETGQMFAVADFGGSFYVFNTENDCAEPDPLFSVFIGIPIRSIAWCPLTNNILVGCVGGGLYWWQFGHMEAQLVLQLQHTFNIIRAVEDKFYLGSSDGLVKIFSSVTMKELGEYKAHFPIHYQTEEERELFGSMKNYAEIWSLAIPSKKKELFIVSSCEDQSQKVFKVDLANQKYELIHHLKGHELAVTSVDWKQMNEKLGEIYVSCSDDKIIRFRDPNQGFKILYEVETSTIKEWHTLTYLALEPQGSRVAVGSQNGYLFIYDIAGRELLFGEKVHMGGVEGLDWVGNKIITCSSDLCVNIFEV